MEEEMSSRFHSQICGKLLGDGCIIKQTGRKPRFQFMHRIDDYEWSNYCYMNLKSFIPLNGPKYKRANDKRVKRGFTESYMVQSRTSDIITLLEKIWYYKKIKQIPSDYVDSYLNEEALAWWYQDDGHLKMANGTPRKVILSTDNFTTSENQQIIGILQQKFSLYFSLDSQNRLILYNQSQILYFHQLVRPYLHSSMDRKVIKFNEENKVFSPKRTTIYLPTNIHIKKPTNEINLKLNLLPHLYKIIASRESYLDFYKKRILPLRTIQPRKSYQIIVEQKHWFYLNIIKKLTGLNYSEIVNLCFKLELTRQI
ncbi:endonuclease [Bacillus seohaeanensis]|uniref:Endonuclease n=1 Tax=Bacillus seohaeanensis TaxID=284580 RepID=A0ABW5RLC6_9BACI